MSKLPDVFTTPESTELIKMNKNLQNINTNLDRIAGHIFGAALALVIIMGAAVFAAGMFATNL